MADHSDSQINAADRAAAKAPLLIEGPKATASTDSPILDLEALQPSSASEGASAEHADLFDALPPKPESRGRLSAYAPIAAAITFSLAIGAVAGGAATTGLLRDSSPAPAVADATRSLQDSVAQLGNELATLKAGIANAQRTASTQFVKLTERLDRADKAQTEPVAKLAKIQESIDRLEHRQQQAAAAPAPEITGSIAPPKEQSKAQIAEGWHLRDFYDGRAVVENRNGMLFRIVPGSNVPGLGRVDTIKRENGRVVVVTASGIIAASLEPRRPAYYTPYR
jgi:hypothetical protein